MFSISNEQSQGRTQGAEGECPPPFDPFFMGGGTERRGRQNWKRGGKDGEKEGKKRKTKQTERKRERKNAQMAPPTTKKK